MSVKDDIKKSREDAKTTLKRKKVLLKRRGLNSQHYTNPQKSQKVQSNPSDVKSEDVSFKGLGNGKFRFQEMKKVKRKKKRKVTALKKYFFK